MGNFIKYYLGGLALAFGLCIVLLLCYSPYPAGYGHANLIVVFEGLSFFATYVPVAYLVYGFMVYKQEMPTPVFFVTLLFPAFMLAIVRFIYFRNMLAGDKYWSYAHLMLVPIASFLSGAIIFVRHEIRRSGYDKGDAVDGVKNDLR